MDKFICPHCGADFKDIDYLNHFHIPAAHPEEVEKEEAERILITEDMNKEYKARKYDEITDALFMAMGIIEDGDSIKYLIEPEEIIEKLIKIITDDNFSEKFVEGKRKFIQRNRSI